MRKKKSNNIISTKFKKLIKENLNYIITTIIAIIGIAISIISLNNNILTSKRGIYSNIILETINNIIIVYKVDDDYQSTYYDNQINTKVKVINIGDGVAKNLKFNWDSENSEKLRSLIRLIDKDKIVHIEDDYPFIKWELPHYCGATNISSKNYHKNIDYLISEKDSHSEQSFDIPFEYMVYFQMICTLASNYNYDINEVMDNINLYIDFEYRNAENEIYEKTIPIKIDFNKTKYRKMHYYSFDISADL